MGAHVDVDAIVVQQLDASELARSVSIDRCPRSRVSLTSTSSTASTSASSRPSSVAADSGRPAPIAIIVGAVAGSLAAIALVVIVLILRRRRRRRAAASRDSWTDKSGDLVRAQSLGHLFMRHAAPVEPYVVADRIMPYPTYTPSRSGAGSSILDPPQHSRGSSAVDTSTTLGPSLSRRPTGSTSVSQWSEGQLFQLAPPVPRLPAQDAGGLATGPAVMIAKPITPRQTRPQAQRAASVVGSAVVQDPPPAYERR